MLTEVAAAADPRRANWLTISTSMSDDWCWPEEGGGASGRPSWELEAEILRLTTRLMMRETELRQAKARLEAQAALGEQQEARFRRRLADKERELRRLLLRKDQEMRDIISQLLLFEAELRREQGRIEALMEQKDQQILQQQEAYRRLQRHGAEDIACDICVKKKALEGQRSRRANSTADLDAREGVPDAGQRDSATRSHAWWSSGDWADGISNGETNVSDRSPTSRNSTMRNPTCDSNAVKDDDQLMECHGSLTMNGGLTSVTESDGDNGVTNNGQLKRYRRSSTANHKFISTNDSITNGLVNGKTTADRHLVNHHKVYAADQVDSSAVHFDSVVSQFSNGVSVKTRLRNFVANSTMNHQLSCADDSDATSNGHGGSTDRLQKLLKSSTGSLRSSLADDSEVLNGFRSGMKVTNHLHNFVKSRKVCRISPCASDSDETKGLINEAMTNSYLRKLAGHDKGVLTNNRVSSTVECNTNGYSNGRASPNHLHEHYRSSNGNHTLSSTDDCDVTNGLRNKSLQNRSSTTDNRLTSTNGFSNRGWSTDCQHRLQKNTTSQPSDDNSDVINRFSNRNSCTTSNCDITKAFNNDYYSSQGYGNIETNKAVLKLRDGIDKVRAIQDVTNVRSLGERDFDDGSSSEKRRIISHRPPQKMKDLKAKRVNPHRFHRPVVNDLCAQAIL